jgi:hypothetical protein
MPLSHPQHPQHAHWLQQQAKAKKLVNLSTILGWGGVGFLLALGPGIAVAVHPGIGGVLMGLGFLAAIGGAIVGQIGRAMQGRVI